MIVLNYVIVDYSSDYTPNLFKVYLNGDMEDIGVFSSLNDSRLFVEALEEDLPIEFTVNLRGKFPSDFVIPPQDFEEELSAVADDWNEFEKSVYASM
jgi:hypothetical protein